MNCNTLNRRFLALVVLVFCLPVHAAEQWLRIRSTNFEMLTTAGEKKGREAILYFEAVRKFFEDSKTMRHMPTTPVRIMAFRSEKEYKPYAAKEFAFAYYQPGFEHDYIVMSSISSDAYPAAIHEYVHLLIRHSGLTLPLWLNEGMADLYSSLEPRGKKLIVGSLLPGRLQILREGRQVPLELIVTADQKSPYYNETNRVNIFYAESWALVHMLALSDAYRAKFGEFLHTLVQERDAANTFRMVYGKTIPQVQQELYAYVNGSRFMGAVFNLQLDTKSEDPDLDTMPAWDAQFAMAEIMASGVEKQAAGGMLLEQLEREEPKRWEPEAALAMLDLRRGEWAKASAHFERAAQLGSTDPRMYYQYGMMLRESRKKDESLTMLRRAAELQPDDEQTHFYLAFDYMDVSQFDKALTEFAHVRHVKAEDAFALFQGEAYACYRLDKKDEARAAAASAKKYAKDDVERRSLDELVAAIDQQPLPQQSPPATAAKVYTGRDLSDDDAARPQLAVATGMFTELVCEGDIARMALTTNGAITWFAMDDPHQIAIRSASGPTVDLNCGRQNPRHVTVHYVANPDAEKKTAGLVRAIDFE